VFLREDDSDAVMCVAQTTQKIDPREIGSEIKTMCCGFFCVWGGKSAMVFKNAGGKKLL